MALISTLVYGLTVLCFAGASDAAGAQEAAEEQAAVRLWVRGALHGVAQLRQRQDDSAREYEFRFSWKTAVARMWDTPLCIGNHPLKIW